MSGIKGFHGDNGVPFTIIDIIPDSINLWNTREKPDRDTPVFGYNMYRSAGKM